MTSSDGVESSSSQPHRSDEQFEDISYFIDNLFPYEAPYENQQTGIENAVETLRQGGCHIIEGPCGTGKTLIAALVAGTLIRDENTKYQRALVVTPVKQQQSAFEDDITEINDSILDTYEFARDAPDRLKPLTSLSIVGKKDLCPYVDSGAISDTNVTGRCSSLITNTYDQSRMKGGDQSPEMGAQEIIESAQSINNDDRLAQSILKSYPRSNLEHTHIEDAEYIPAPIDFSGDSVCPYYAQFIVDDELDNRTINYNNKVLDAKTLRQLGTQLGTCPYTAMKDGIDEAEVIVGNYAHIFHRSTVEAITQSVVDETTLLIVDEAHMLVEKVRNYLTVSFDWSDLEEARREIDLLEEARKNLDDQVKDEVEKALSRGSTSISGARAFRQFIKEFEEYLEEIISTFCSKRESEGGVSKYDSIPLRHPEKISSDQIDLWFDHNNMGDEFFERSQYRGRAIGQALKIIANKSDVSVETKPQYSCEKIGQFVTKKFYADRVDYFCEISLIGDSSSGSWSYNSNSDPHENYNINVSLKNCIPASDLTNTFDKFGGTLLMSATISPPDVYAETVGANEVNGPTRTDLFDVRFPEENRGSYIVDLPRFTSDNRESHTASNDIRVKYSETIIDILENVEGNTLICMPNYDEAKWIASEIEDNLDRPLYVDESSSNDRTREIKEQFEQETNGVLTTGLRGTLTEGVDYSGDKLNNVIVVGVPLTNPFTNHAKAIETAYAIRFSRRKAFNYAFTVPAIYKTRQALGRVIRSSKDVGTRILLDERYTEGAHRSVNEFLTEQEQSEYTKINQDSIAKEVSDFWESA